MRDEDAYSPNYLVQLVAQSGRGIERGERRKITPHDHTKWTDEKIDLLKTLWGEGLSARQCAMRMGGGLTRCSVIGKVHRLGLELRGHKHNRVHARVTNGKIRKPRRKNDLTWGKPKSLVPLPVEPLPPRHETDIPRVAFMDLEDHHCRFIPGDPVGPFEKQFCGDQRTPGSSYCRVHTIRCAPEPAPQRTRKAPTPIPTFQVYVNEQA